MRDNIYNGDERRQIFISEEQAEDIATRSAKKALDQVYADIGQGVVKKLAWLIGIAITAVGTWFATHYKG